MGNLSDNFSQLAFDARWSVATPPRDRDAERIMLLLRLQGVLREAREICNDADVFEDLSEHMEEKLRCIPLMVQQIQDEADLERAA